MPQTQNAPHRRLRIIVVLDHGIVHVENVPAGIDVAVKDYDTVATGESIYPGDLLLEDDSGRYYETVWGSSES